MSERARIYDLPDVDGVVIVTTEGEIVDLGEELRAARRVFDSDTVFFAVFRD